MRLSKNLPLKEFLYSNTSKRRNIPNEITEEHLKNGKLWAKHVFQPVRNHFGQPVFLSSGYRSKRLNKAVKGSRKSQHCRGEAGDLDNDKVTSPTNRQIFYYIKNYINFDQLIWEFGDKESPDWVHVSYSPTGKQRGVILISKRNKWGKIYYEYF